MASVLITGGAGFIGSHTAERLLAAGHAVTILDDFSSGSPANLAAIAASIQVIEADVRDARQIHDLLAAGGFDAVVHLAARASVAGSVADPAGSHDVNVTGTLNVLEAARHAGVRRVVVASSAAVYGDDPPLPCVETALPAPRSPYAAQKAACELLCAAYHASYGLETVALRYFNVYGPRQPATSSYSGVIAAAVGRLVAGERMVIYGDGEQTRDFIHVADVAAVNHRVVLGPYPGPEPINVATGQAVSVLGIVTMMRRLARVDAALSFAAPRAGDVRHSRAAVERLQDRTGYQAAVPLDQGLRDLLDWARQP